MATGTYGNESGSYYVNAAGAVYLIQSADMRPGETSQRVDALPSDAKRINANDLEVPAECLSAAEQIAAQFDNDGTCWVQGDTRLVDVLNKRRSERRVNPNDPDCVAYEFADGSAIVTAGGCWDLRHERCTCGFHFAGERVLPACAVGV